MKRKSPYLDGQTNTAGWIGDPVFNEKKLLHRRTERGQLGSPGIMVKKKTRYPAGHKDTAAQSGAAVINEKSRCLPDRRTRSGRPQVSR